MDEKHNQLVVSEHQLDRAIQLFLDEADYYSSGTLAGATEEILGNLLLRSGREHAIDNAISTVLKMLSVTEIDVLSDKPNKSPRGRVSDVLNFYWNWLKHYQEADFELYIDAKEAASELIDRAVSNFFQLTSRETQQMRRFLEYQRQQ